MASRHPLQINKFFNGHPIPYYDLVENFDYMHTIIYRLCTFSLYKILHSNINRFSHIKKSITQSKLIQLTLISAMTGKMHTLYFKE